MLARVVIISTRAHGCQGMFLFLRSGIIGGCCFRGRMGRRGDIRSRKILRAVGHNSRDRSRVDTGLLVNGSRDRNRLGMVCGMVWLLCVGIILLLLLLRRRGVGATAVSDTDGFRPGNWAVLGHRWLRGVQAGRET